MWWLIMGVLSRFAQVRRRSVMESKMAVVEGFCRPDAVCNV